MVCDGCLLKKNNTNEGRQARSTLQMHLDPIWYLQTIYKHFEKHSVIFFLKTDLQGTVKMFVENSNERNM